MITPSSLRESIQKAVAHLGIDLANCEVGGLVFVDEAVRVQITSRGVLTVGVTGLTLPFPDGGVFVFHTHPTRCWPSELDLMSAQRSPLPVLIVGQDGAVIIKKDELLTIMLVPKDGVLFNADKLVVEGVDVEFFDDHWCRRGGASHPESSDG